MQGATNSSLKLPSVLDLAAAETLLDAMRQACDAQTATVDASGVDVVTSPCMQVILATLKASPGMRIENPSKAFVEAFADLALDWRQDDQAADQEDDQEPATEDTQDAAAPAPINPEDDTEAAFLVAAQQYTEVNDEPAAEPAEESVSQSEAAPTDRAEASAETADEAPAPRNCRRRSKRHIRYSNARGFHAQAHLDDRRFENHTGHA